MAYSLIWLPGILKNAGLKVAEVDGWETRGRAEMGRVLGVMCHHTAGGKNGNMPSLGVITKGRSDLPGPLAHLGLGRDGTFYIVAAGRCNHAGSGSWQGLQNGNSNFIGIEAENTGLSNDLPWPAVQMDAYQRGVAAILKHVDRSYLYCCGHKEFKKPAGAKIDPTFDMSEFRLSVKAIMEGTAVIPPLIPRVEPQPATGTARLTIRRGDKGDLVRALQQKLGLPVDGDFGPKTEAAVREFQRSNDLVPDGIVGPKTWHKIGS
jgi:hypothetical protein